MEEGFNYPAGTSLATNAPWAGSAGSSVSVASGNLTLTNLAATVPPGNLLQISGGTSRTVYRNFSSNAVTGGAVYFSALIRCTVLPTATNSQFLASLMDAGNTSPSRDTDPLDLYVATVTNGYRFSVISAGSDSATIRQTLLANTTHFIVLKYVFSSSGQGSIYVDPAPGSVEPSSATATTSGGDGGAGAANLQMVLFHSSSSAGQGSFSLDTLRVGTNWADVTPMPTPLSLTGPADAAVCFGSGASFSVLAAGTPPFTYQWRTNGINVGNATTNVLTLTNPGGNDTLKNYDVVVTDSFGSVTSRVAKLIFSTTAAGIITQPVSQVAMPGSSNVMFSVTVSGDVPLSFQWRTNGVALSGATNSSYTLNNPGPADTTNALDVVVSNPCGSVTSSPPVAVIFPTLFYAAYDAGAGFFSGENLIFTNTSGMNFYVWSTPDLSVSVTNWFLEGPMSELPLGTTGFSRYGINVNPVTSPAYYIVTQTNQGPYTVTEPLITLTTPDFASFTVTCSNLPISASGIFNQNTFYPAYDAGAGFFSGENLIFTNTSGMSFYVWSSPDLSVSVTNWTLEGATSELPLGTSGNSRYGINLNPVTSPVYYIFAQTNIGPYTPTEALVWLTTADFASFTVASSNVTISAAGVFAQNSSPIAQNAFNMAYDAGPGFFSGENLVFTSASGANFYVWSSPDPSVAVTNWTLEGAMSELPLGTTGDSKYGINLNPQTSQVYYIFAQTNTGIYTPTEAVVWLTTADYQSFIVSSSNAVISAAGIFAFPALPIILQPPQSQTVLVGKGSSFNVTATGTGLGYRWLFNNNNIASASAPVLNLTNVTSAATGTYVVIVTNNLGSVTSSIAILSITLPPALNLGASPPGTIQLNANSITGLTYIVQSATNLFHPVWVPVLTNNTGTGGVVNFQTNTAGRPSQFYRLFFP